MQYIIYGTGWPRLYSYIGYNTVTLSQFYMIERVCCKVFQFKKNTISEQ